MSDARLAGFDNLNLDLIYGIPHQTLDSWRWTLDQALQLQPDHVSLYALGLEDGTPMKVWVERGQLPEPDDDLTADMYDLATEVLAVAGYEQYEISNWSRAGKSCRHNLQYWYNAPYLGLGPGAHGFFPGVRYSTVLSPQRYIRQMGDADSFSGNLPMTPAVEDVIYLDRDDEIAETLLMGLRLVGQGIDRADFRARYGIELLDHAGVVIRKYEALGLLSVSDTDVRLTQQGRFLSNAIFRELVVG